MLGQMIGLRMVVNLNQMQIQIQILFSIRNPILSTMMNLMMKMKMIQPHSVMMQSHSQYRFRFRFQFRFRFWYQLVGLDSVVALGKEEDEEEVVRSAAVLRIGSKGLDWIQMSGQVETDAVEKEAVNLNRNSYGA